MNFSCFYDTTCNPASASIDRGYDESASGHNQDLPYSSLDQCSMHSDGEQEVMLASIEKPTHDESIINYGSLSSCKNRKVRSRSCSYLNKHVLEDPLFDSSDKSIPPVARDADDGLVPGNIDCVKAVHNDGWPAECFDGRTKNTSAAMKDDASKQELCKYENGSIEMLSSIKHEKSPDASKTSVSSNSKDDDHDKEEGRGKRKRRSKLHFDEMAIPDNPARKLRRLKIMRLLGLAAPVGSPFSHSNRSA